MEPDRRINLARELVRVCFIDNKPKEFGCLLSRNVTLNIENNSIQESAFGKNDVFKIMKCRFFSQKKRFNSYQLKSVSYIPDREDQSKISVKTVIQINVKPGSKEKYEGLHKIYVTNEEGQLRVSRIKSYNSSRIL